MKMIGSSSIKLLDIDVYSAILSIYPLMQDMECRVQEANDRALAAEDKVLVLVLADLYFDFFLECSL